VNDRVTGRELYFYWRALGGAASALQATRTFQQTLAARWPDLQTRLLVRSDGTTLMEVYAGADEAMLERLVVEGDAATAPWRSGPRHLEVFDAA